MQNRFSLLVLYVMPIYMIIALDIIIIICFSINCPTVIYLYYFLGLTYWSSAQFQFLSVACFLFCRNPISNGAQMEKNGWRYFLEYLWFLGSKINVKRYPRWARGRGARPTPQARPTPRSAPDPRGPPVRRLTLFFWRKKDNFMRKIWAKDSP